MRIVDVIERLLDHYGPRGWWPLVPARGERPRYVSGRHHESRTPDEVFEIGVGAVLTQRAAWRNVSPVLAELSRLDALTPVGLATLGDERLAATIRSCGTFRRKVRTLEAWAQLWRHAPDVDGGLEDAMTAIPGFGPEIVDSILLYGLGVPRFIADAYARRILVRLGLVDAAPDYRHLQRTVHDREVLDRRACDEGHALLVEVGKNHCHPRPACSGCPLAAFCPRVGVAS